jgi:WD40 repeat protein
VRCVAYSPDGKTLASGQGIITSGGYAIKLWDVQQKGKLKATLSGQTLPVCSVAFSPDGKTLASGGDDKKIRLWDVVNGKERASVVESSEVDHVAFSPNGKTLVSVCRAPAKKDMTSSSASKDKVSSDHTIKLWDVRSSPKAKATLGGHTEMVRCVVFSPDGKTLASGSDDKTIKLWDVPPDE